MFRNRMLVDSVFSAKLVEWVANRVIFKDPVFAIGGLRIQVTTRQPVDLEENYQAFLAKEQPEYHLLPCPSPTDFAPSCSDSSIPLEVGLDPQRRRVFRFADGNGPAYYLSRLSTTSCGFSCNPPGMHHNNQWIDLSRFPTQRVFIAAITEFLCGTGFFLHAMAALYNGRGLVFCGPSGAGKSTLAEAWTKQEAQVFCDERCIITKQGSGFNVCGSPWPGSFKFVHGGSAPLSCLVFLRASGPDIEQISSAAEFLREILPETYHRPWDIQFTESLFTLLTELFTCIPVFRVNRSAAGSPADFFERIRHC